MVAMRNFGKKLSAKPLPVVEVEAYQCGFEYVERFALMTKDRKDPKYTALTLLGWCLDEEMPKK